MKTCAFCAARHYVGPYDRCYRCGAPLPVSEAAPIPRDEELDNNEEGEQDGESQNDALRA